jgi:hypothetical protein
MPVNQATRFVLDDERNEIWYLIIQLEYQILNGRKDLKVILNSYKRRYDYICRILRY